MNTTYQILAKHFQGLTSPEEDTVIEKFKKDNPKEYESLEGLWHTQLAEVKDFDKEAAWNKIQQKVPKKNTKVVPLFGKISAIAATLLILIMATLFINKNLSTSKMELVYNDLETIMEVELPDGSMAILNQGASISYPEKFNRSQRRVVMQGEVFYDVARDSLKPFKIETPHAGVEVLGTSFNINSNDMATDVSVKTGIVRATSNFSEAYVILEKGEKVQATSSTLVESLEENVNIAAWGTGVFTYEGESISEVITSLNEYYNNRIVLIYENSNCSISTTFERMELKYVVEIISATCNLNTRENNGTYELY